MNLYWLPALGFLVMALRWAGRAFKAAGRPARVRYAVLAALALVAAGSNTCCALGWL